MLKEVINSICPITENSIRLIEAIATYETILKGDVFIEKGKSNYNEYILLEGICKSYLLNPDGEEVTITFFNSRSVVSPFTTRISNGKSILNFRAITNAQVAILDAGLFEKLMIDHLEIRNFANIILRNELNAKIEKEIELVSSTAKERLIKFRKKYPAFENFVPHADIASYLGITTISLSRLRRGLMKEEL